MVENPYNFFDEIVCINLLSRDDRYTQASKIFSELQIPVRFYRVSKDTENSERGCYTSHMTIIKNAYNSGKKNVLIFEDDVRATDNYSIEKVGECVDFMRNNQDWDLFFLGYCHAMRNLCLSNLKPIPNSNIVKLKGFCAHAYCINRKMMKYLIKYHPVYRGDAFDTIFLTIGNHYSIYPMLFAQNVQIDNDIQHSSLGRIDGLLYDMYQRIEQIFYINGLLEKCNYHLKTILVLLAFACIFRKY